MADVKISGLPASTVPLAGTEVLPIVQSGVTKKVAVSDLTAGRSVSMSTLGVGTTTPEALIDVYSPTQGYAGIGIKGYAGAVKWYVNAGVSGTSINIFNIGNNANGTSPYLAIAPTGGVSIGDVTDPGAGNLRLGTGNLVMGTSGKGIDFSATAGTGTSELLNDYEEGTWTPTYSGDGGNPTVTYSTRSGTYTKVGRVVTITCSLVIATVSGGSGQLRIAGLPFTNGGNNCGLSNGFVFNFFLASPQQYVVSAGLDSISLYQSSFTNTVSTTADLQASAFLFISGSYVV